MQCNVSLDSNKYFFIAKKKFSSIKKNQYPHLIDELNLFSVYKKYNLVKSTKIPQKLSLYYFPLTLTTRLTKTATSKITQSNFSQNQWTWSNRLNHFFNRRHSKRFFYEVMNIVITVLACVGSKNLTTKSPHQNWSVLILYHTVNEHIIRVQVPSERSSPRIQPGAHTTIGECYAGAAHDTPLRIICLP